MERVSMSSSSKDGVQSAARIEVSRQKHITPINNIISEIEMDLILIGNGVAVLSNLLVAMT